MSYKNIRYATTFFMLLPLISNGMNRSLMLYKPKVTALALRQPNKFFLPTQTKRFSSDHASAVKNLCKLIADRSFDISEAQQIIKTMKFEPTDTSEVHLLQETVVFHATEFYKDEKKYANVLKDLAAQGWKRRSPYGHNKSAAPLLHSAVISGLPEVTKELLSQNKSGIHDRDLDECTPLHYAWLRDIGETLLNNGAAVDVVDRDGNTPLHTVSADMVLPLLEAGADGYRCSNKYVRVPSHGWARLTPLRQAVDGGDVKKFIALILNLPKIDDEERALLKSLAHLRHCRSKRSDFKHIHDILGYLPKNVREVAVYFTHDEKVV